MKDLIHIKELFRLQSIQHLRLIAGREGLERTVTAAVLFEYDPSRVQLPDFYRGDLVVTTLAYARGDAQLVAECQAIAAQTGATLDFLSDPAAAVQGANVIYTDIWVSMGEPESVWAERIAALAPYQVNAALMAKAGPNAIFMHCLPAYHDKKTAIGNEMCTRFGREAMEVTDDVFESAQSVVFQEAENRMHTIKAVMAATLAEIEL